MTLNNDKSPNAKSKHSRSPLNQNSHAKGTCGLFHHKRDMANTKCVPIQQAPRCTCPDYEFTQRTMQTHLAQSNTC